MALVITIIFLFLFLKKHIDKIVTKNVSTVNNTKQTFLKVKILKFN
jgi:hypothetical protein